MKKVISVFLIMMILSGLTACGQKNNGSGGETEAAPETTVESTAEASADTASGTTTETITETAAETDSEMSQTAESIPAAAPQGSTAEVPAAQNVLPEEEQRRILEENRSLWTFDEGEYSPDWYYTFTDLDHNGLLEVLSASTQGSGIFTYARFYEVLPDGSGIRNLYHADVEIQVPDDWPEIILETIPCYYDKASDRYYYICTNSTRDGAAHAVSRIAALCLKDGAAEWEYLASMETQVTEDGKQESWLDSSGNPITEEDYNKTADNRFAGMEQSELKLDWISGTSQ